MYEYEPNLDTQRTLDYGARLMGYLDFEDYEASSQFEYWDCVAMAKAAANG